MDFPKKPSEDPKRNESCEPWNQMRDLALQYRQKSSGGWRVEREGVGIWNERVNRLNRYPQVFIVELGASEVPAVSRKFRREQNSEKFWRCSEVPT